MEKVVNDTLIFMWKTINSFLNGKISFMSIEPIINEYLTKQIKKKYYK